MIYNNSLEVYIKRFGIENGTEKFNERSKNNILRLIDLADRGYSKISQDLFWNIFYNLSDEEKKICKFAELNKEEVFYFLGTNIKGACIDFKVGEKIIEFYGDFWHAKKELYEDDCIMPFFMSKKKITAKERRRKDELRIQKLNDFGYKVLIVWESDYKKDKEGTVQSCLNFLNL